MSARIIRAATIAQYGAADSVLEDARREAARLLQTARTEALAEGERLLGALRAEAEAEKLRVLAETSTAAQGMIHALHADVAEALSRAVARVLGELDMAEAVARAAAHALGEVSARHGTTVHVHPTGLAHARAALEGAANGVRIVADENLPPDGCVLETEAGLVRATLSDQLAVLRTAFLNAAEQEAARV